MMKKHSEALRLAEAIEQLSDLVKTFNEEAANELRRLHEVNKELVEALKNTTTNLVAAHSLLQGGGEKAAASNTMFEIMLKDYEKSIEVGRAALKKLEDV